MMKISIAGCATALALAASISAQPGPTGREAARTSIAPEAKAVVTEVRRLLAENYVLPDVRPKLDAILAQGLAAGRYSVADPAALADRVNEDLTAVAHDKHLSLRYDPEQAARIAARPPQDENAPDPPEWQRRAQLRNHGLVEMKVLPGNIRYLDMDGFVWAGPKSAEAQEMAMRFLRDGDAVIIDLRRNGGGSPDAVQYLVSHFLEPNRPLVTFHMGATRVDRLSTLPTLPAGRMIGKPLYVLTSERTASAAEEFTGHVAGFKLGELIGETTAGAGFRNDLLAVPGGYVLSVSVGRAVLASTGKDWEGVGIAPTVKVDAPKALQVAQMRALRRIAANAAPDEKARLEAMAALLAAQIDPVPTALPLAAYAGTFGERVVTVENGRLALQRNGGPKLVMIPIGPNVFAFEADAMTRIEYSVAGTSVTGFELIRNDGNRVVAARTS